MGKGVLPDDHPMCIAAARSKFVNFRRILHISEHYLINLNRNIMNSILFFSFRALQQADVILLLGARLNWILHFGIPPRFNPDVKIIQVTVDTIDSFFSYVSNMHICRALVPIIRKTDTENANRAHFRSSITRTEELCNVCRR